MCACVCVTGAHIAQVFDVGRIKKIKSGKGKRFRDTRVARASAGRSTMRRMVRRKKGPSQGARPDDENSREADNRQRTWRSSKWSARKRKGLKEGEERKREKWYARTYHYARTTNSSTATLRVVSQFWGSSLWTTKFFSTKNFRKCIKRTMCVRERERGVGTPVFMEKLWGEDLKTVEFIV